MTIMSTTLGNRDMILVGRGEKLGKVSRYN